MAQDQSAQGDEAGEPPEPSEYDRPRGQFMMSTEVLKAVNEHGRRAILEYGGQERERLDSLLKSVDSEGRIELKRFTDWLGEALETQGEPGEFTPVGEEIGDLKFDAAKTLVLTNRMKTFIPEMSLVYLVAQFNDFLAETLRITLSRQPAILKASRKQVAVEDVMEFNSLDDLKAHVIDQEIQDVLYRDIEDAKRSIARRYAVDIGVFDGWEDFKERLYRRNIIMHNAGRPNAVYRRRTGYVGSDDQLTVSEDYMIESFDLFAKAVNHIHGSFVTKFAPDEGGPQAGG